MKSAVVVIALLISLLPVFTATSGSPLSTVTSNGNSAHSVHELNITISNDTILKHNLIVSNLVIDSGITLVTNGYSIICNDTFLNNGLIRTGFSGPGDHALSFGGSGGGAYQKGNPFIDSSRGYSTRVAGGNGSDISSANPGSGTLIPSLNLDLIRSWFSSGMNSYLTGSAGQPLGSHDGGLGGNGIYIQADIIENFGTISADGQNGFNMGGLLGLSGAGGGGVVILSYDAALIDGQIFTRGGSGSHYGNMSSGNGGDGQTVMYQYPGILPIKPVPLVFSSNIPWLHTGNFLNYTLTTRYVTKVNPFTPTNQSYARLEIQSINTENQTFEFSVELPNTIPSPPVISYLYSSYVSPGQFPALTPLQLSQLQNGTIPGTLLVLLNTNGSYSIQNTTLKIAGHTYGAFEITFAEQPTPTYVTAWISKQTGLLLKEVDYDFEGGSTYLYSNVTLAASNIRPPAHHDNIVLYIAIAAILSAVVALAAYLYTRRDLFFQEYTETPSEVIQKLGSKAIEARIKELKSLLETGVIDQSYYDNSVKLLREMSEE